MIDGIIDSIESTIYGKRSYNLEISIKKDALNNFSQENLKCIERYVGSFVVTESGYLLGGCDNRLEQRRTANITGCDFLSRGIIYFEDGEMDAIIKDIFGRARLWQLANKKETNRRYQPAEVAFA